MRHFLFGVVLMSLACSDGDSPTYYRDAKAIIDARCVTCHQEGDIGPFPLTTYTEIEAFRGAVRAALVNGTMPPWQPSDDCNEYEGNIDLTDAERETLIAWIDSGASEGNPADAPLAAEPEEDFLADLSLRLPEPYTPTREPDDYRCQLIEWPADTTRFVTGARVTPDQGAIVHHVILFLVGPDQVEQFRAYDEAEDGPGYTCYGGPQASDDTGGGILGDVDPAEVLAALDRIGLSLTDLRSGNFTPEQLSMLTDELGVDPAGGFSSIGSWVPGTPARPFPAGTGIRVEPGSMIAAQFHYNTTTSAPVADQSTIEIATTDSVEREATMLPAVDIGWITNGAIGGNAMTIPANEPNVEHSTTIGFDSFFLAGARRTLGLADDAPLLIHRANHHMHELGTRQRSELQHADGSMSCLLDIPEWDFAWQGSYALQRPLPFQAGDQLWMGCAWNNTEANQPIIDGEPRQPRDVSWGEGTSDEMCLGAFYVTAAE